MEDVFEINDLVEPKSRRRPKRTGIVLENQCNFYHRPVRSGNPGDPKLVDRITVLWCNGEVCYEPAIYIKKVMNKTSFKG